MSPDDDPAPGDKTRLAMRGVEIARAFYEAVVAPMLAGVPHAAGRLGSGSDVLGYDDEMMHLTLLLERRWSPYSKWLGTAYDARGRRLDTETSLCQALDELAGRDVTVQFWDRPYQTIEPDFLSSLPAGLPLPTGIATGHPTRARVVA